MDRSGAFSISAKEIYAWRRRRVAGILAAMAIAMSATPSAAEPSLVLEAKIPLGSVAGRIDHLAVDTAGGRLFVAELGNDSVGVIDLKAGVVSHRIAGLKEPQGVGYFAPTDTLYVANAGDGSVRLYRGAGLTPSGRTELGGDADNVRVDPARNRVWVGYGDGGLAALDPGSGQKIMDIPLKAHPESFQLDPSGTKIFVNVPDAGQIATVDAVAGKQLSAVSPRGARANFPMALDPATNRILAVFRSPPRLMAFGMADGAPVASIEVCGDADDVFVDAKRARIYVSCGAGSIDVLAPRGDGYERIDRIATVSGARTALFVPAFDRLYLAVRASSGEAPAIWVFRPAAAGR